jgi:predicted transcriptional regulator
VAKGRKTGGGKREPAAGAERSALRVSRSTLARVSGGRVIANHRPTQDTQRKMELLMSAVSVLRFDPAARVPEGVPDTYEKLYDRALEQFLDLYDAEPEFRIPSVIGPNAKRRSIWVRGDLMLRVEEIAQVYPCSVSRIIEMAIDSYVDRHTRGIDKKLINTLAATAQKILDSSEVTGKSLRERERKARKVMRTGQV